MTKLFAGRPRLPDWSALLVSAALLGIYLYHVIPYVFILPDLSVSLITGDEAWIVESSTHPGLKEGDELIRIGALTFDEYSQDRFKALLEGYATGDDVLSVTSVGNTVQLSLREAPFDVIFSRLFAVLWFFPFWITGTGLLLFLRPRDLRWRLLIAFMYMTALWSTLGIIASFGIGGSRVTVGLLEWLMVPVFLQLHLTVPGPLFPRLTRWLFPGLYSAAIILALAEIMQLPPADAPLTALAIAIAISFALLLYRSFGRSAPVSDRTASRLMLAGIGLAFGPGVLFVVVPGLLGLPVQSELAATFAFFAIPVLPIFYSYAIYKRQLGALEFRANRLLSLYSFILIYPTIFILLLLAGEQWINSDVGRTFYLLAISIVFALLTPPILSRFQSLLNRLAYGAKHDPDDILHAFALQIPSALTRDVLVELLTQDITPSLLIRQSSLCLFTDEQVEVVYGDNLPENGTPRRREQLDRILSKPPTFILPRAGQQTGLDWVRLAVPLIVREETIGVWLFGRRDPDDFYPRKDIELLQALTNQMAPVVENIRLYEALQQHADSLADEVTKRTAELQAEKDRTQAVLDSAGEGIFFTDAMGVILYTNQAMATLSGYSADELVGKPLNLWQVEDDTAGAYRQLWTAIYSGQDWGGELLLRRQDGSYRDVNLSISPIHSGEGQISGFVGVQSDISKLKEVDRLKSNIISNVSHELKTPLTTIRTYLMLLERGKAEKREGYLAVLSRESDRLTNIIEDLLDLSTLEAGKIPSRLEPVNVITVVDEVVVRCQARASVKDIDLRANVPDDLPSANADLSQLEQVLTNLVVNAVNYTHVGGRVLVDAGSGELDGEPAIWLRVSDNGPGIAIEDAPQLFERFYRGTAARESASPGTGLGLAICKEIIDRHQGKIEVDSEPGNGAAFTVWLHAEPTALVTTQVDLAPQEQHVLGGD